MAHHPVNWFNISGPNGKILHKFYKRIFDWNMTPLPGPMDAQMVAKEADGIPGGIGASSNGLPNVTVYIAVGNLESYLAKVHQAGGQLAMPPMDLPGNMGRIAGFTDPAGNWIGLWQNPTKGALSTPKKRAAAAKKPAAKKKKAAAPKKKAKARR